MTTIIGWPRFMPTDWAMVYVGGQTIFDDLKAKDLLKARVQRKGLTRYDRVELDDALDKWEGFSE